MRFFKKTSTQAQEQNNERAKNKEKHEQQKVMRKAIIYYLLLIKYFDIKINDECLTGVDNLKQLSDNFQKLIEKENINWSALTKQTPIHYDNGRLSDVMHDDYYSAWVKNDILCLVPLYFDLPEHTNLSDDEFKQFFSLSTIPIDNILHFKFYGEVWRETKITGSGGGGGGSSVGDAIIGGLIAGDAGAVIASRREIEPIKINSQTITHDDRRCELYYKKDNKIEIITFRHDDYDILKELIPKKEYAYIQRQKEQEMLATQQPQPTQIASSIPDQIRELAKLKDDGILTEEEFASKKAELLSKM